MNKAQIVSSKGFTRQSCLCGRLVTASGAADLTKIWYRRDAALKSERKQIRWQEQRMSRRSVVQPQEFSVRWGGDCGRRSEMQEQSGVWSSVACSRSVWQLYRRAREQPFHFPLASPVPTQNMETAITRPSSMSTFSLGGW